MLDAKTLQWLEHRKITCNRCGMKLCILPRQGTFTGECARFRVKATGMERGVLIEDFQDAAEFEARVAVYLTGHDVEDVPCAHGMVFFCPKPPFMGKDCTKWCLLRDARLAVEQEMLAEGKGPGRSVKS